MVLFGTEAVVQSDRRVAVPYPLGISEFGSAYNQREAGGSTAFGISPFGTNVYYQTGSGIVADSIPEREYEETAQKAAGMQRAIRLGS